MILILKHWSRQVMLGFDARPPPMLDEAYFNMVRTHSISKAIILQAYAFVKEIVPISFYQEQLYGLFVLKWSNI